MYQEVLRQKKVSNIILAFLDHLKPRMFFVDQPWWLTESIHFFKNLWIRPWNACTSFRQIFCFAFYLLIKPAALVLVQWENVHVSLILTGHCFA